MQEKISSEVQNFDDLPNGALVRIKSAAILTSRCRQTLYRDIKKGLLEQVQIGGSARIPVGSLRSYMLGLSCST